MTDLVRQLDCLRGINSTKLVAATANVSIPTSTSLVFKGIEKVGGTSPFSLIVDGVEISVHPLQAFLSGNFNQVPILMGANRDEFVSRALYEGLTGPRNSVKDYMTGVLPVITHNNSKLPVLYHPSRFNDNYMQACVTLFSQYIFICGTRRMAGYMSRQPTYLYTYNHVLETPRLSSPDIVMWPGAYHAAELFSLFQTLADSFYGNMIFDPDEVSLANSLRLYWTNMITKGQPNDNVSLT